MSDKLFSAAGDRHGPSGRKSRFSRHIQASSALVTAFLLAGLTVPADAQLFWPSDNSASARVERKRVRHARNRAPKTETVKETSKPVGPVVIAISVEKQQLKIHDNNGVFAESPVSTGTASHPTPQGVFSVIGKEVFHRSNIYSGAPMPHMQRITWSGVAMHAGVLPGYPASHGCIRLPPAFATRMFGWTKVGARVVIAPGELAPADFSHPFLMSKKPDAPDPNTPVAASTVPTASSDELRLASTTGKSDETRKGEEIKTADASGAVPSAPATADDTKSDLKLDKDQAKPEAAKDGSKDGAKDGAKEATKDAAKAPLPVPGMANFIGPIKPRSGQIAAFISRKTGRLYVRQNFEPLFDVPVTIAATDRPLGTHVFTVRSEKDDDKKLQWTVISLPTPPARTKRADRKKGAPVEQATPQTPLGPSEALDKITVPEDAMTRIAMALSPGGSITVSDHGLGDETGKGTDFIVPLRDPSGNR